MEAACYKNDGTVAILDPATPLNASTVDRLRGEWLTWFDNNKTIRHVIVDLQEVSFIDSSGMGLLIALHRRATTRGGDLRVAGIQKPVRLVFEITLAHKLLEIFDNVDEALQSLA